MADIAKIDLEQKAVVADLSTYLTNAGWTGLTYTQGWPELDITNPLINVIVLDLGPESLGLGKTTERLFNRSVQVDVYMERENRVTAIQEDIVEWMDRVVSIVDFDSTILGTLICRNEETIVTAIIPPELNNPEILRWRGVVRGNFDAHYPNG